MRPLLFLLSTLLFPGCDAHAAAEPYGKRFLSASDPLAQAPALAEQGPGQGETVASDADAAEASLRRRVELEELRGGPYAPGLAETYGDLARLLEARGAFDEADRFRDRALHLVRVNEGLYSPSQGPLVRARLRSLRRRGDFETLDERYEYFFRLYGSGQPPYNGVRWGATVEFLRWQREAIRRRLDRDPRRRLLDLHSQHQALLRTLFAEPAPDAGRIHDATLSQLATLYLISDLEPPRELALSARGGRVRQEDPLEFDLLRERLESLQRSLRSRGRSLIEEALAVTPASDADRRAALNLALGDWLLWQGAPASAHEVYEALWAQATDPDLQARVASWFERPVPLPALPVFAIPDQPTGPPLDLILDVTEIGRPMPRTPAGEDSAGIARLRRYVQTARFRPAYSDGRAVRTQGLRTTWVLVGD